MCIAGYFINFSFKDELLTLSLYFADRRGKKPEPLVGVTSSEPGGQCHLSCGQPEGDGLPHGTKPETQPHHNGCKYTLHYDHLSSRSITLSKLLFIIM